MYYSCRIVPINLITNDLPNDIYTHKKARTLSGCILMLSNPIEGLFPDTAFPNDQFSCQDLFFRDKILLFDMLQK